MNVSNASLHYTILRYMLDHGFAPGVPELARLLNADQQAVESGLYTLQDYHGVVLHPHAPKVWVIHPFSTAPTNFLVESVRGSWWGNCAWCSLGVAALLQPDDVTIRTSAGAHGNPVTITIREGVVEQTDLYVHFPIPMVQAWDNVIYTCSTMLVFRSPADVEVWSRQHNIPMGDIQSVAHAWAFAQRWYGNHLNPNWEKWTLDEARILFAEFRLTHPVWQLPGGDERF